MYTLLVVIHVVNCLVMVGAVLLQSGKGADIGAAFGGSSQTVFGGRGAATFLSKVTVGAAVLFFATSLSLSILTRARSSSSSVIESPKSSETTSATPTPVAAPDAAASTTTTSTVEGTHEVGTPDAAPSTDASVSVPQTTPAQAVTPTQ